MTIGIISKPLSPASEMRPIDRVHYNKGALSGAIASLPGLRANGSSGSAHRRNLQLHLADKKLRVEIAVTGRAN